MRLDQRLVELGLFESRAKAQAAIAAGGVCVDGRIVSKPAFAVGLDAVLTARAAFDFVGRGGLKLDCAFQLWPISAEGRIVADVGASTGGFTDVCLRRGAARIYAIDVGHDQLHPTLRADPRVVSLEGLDARDATRAELPEPPDLIVTDVSFISLLKALPAVLGLSAPQAELVALIKPQFELGRAAIGKGGRVLGEDPVAEATAQVSQGLTALGWRMLEVAPSPVLGGDGAVEGLLWARRMTAAPVA